MNPTTASQADTLRGSLIPRKNSRVAARVVDGKALLVVIDHKQLHTLNEVGTFVWEACDGRTIDAMVEALADEFEVEHEHARADLEEFLERLRALGALELESRP